MAVKTAVKLRKKAAKAKKRNDREKGWRKKKATLRVLERADCDLFWVLCGENLDRRPAPLFTLGPQPDSAESGRWVSRRHLKVDDVLLFERSERARIIWLPASLDDSPRLQHLTRMYEFSIRPPSMIRCTPNHPFYVRDKGWTAAVDLRPSDLLMTPGGDWVPVDRAEGRGEVEPVYNIQVADNHTYFVGGTNDGPAVLVHNACEAIEQAEDAVAAPAQLAVPDKSPGAGASALRGSDIWTGEIKTAAGEAPIKFKFVIKPMWPKINSEQELQLANAVVEAAQRIYDVYLLLKYDRERLKKTFVNVVTDPDVGPLTGPTGKMLLDDNTYNAVLANFEKVIEGIKSGKVVLEFDPKYHSATEGLIHTDFFLDISALRITEMLFVKALFDDPNTIVWNVRHELSRRFFGSDNSDDPVTGVNAWDTLNDLLWRRRGEFADPGVRGSGG